MPFGSILRELRLKKSLTQLQLAEALGISASAIGMYEQGRRKPDFETLEVIADYFNVSMGELLEDKPCIKIPENLTPLAKIKKVPLLGRIACGKPIYAEENIEEYVQLPEGVRADFALACEGDSMIGAHIEDGDIVYILSQPMVENREIAAVKIGDKATLKRVHKMDDGSIILLPENPAYPPITLTAGSEPQIIGRAVAVLKIIP